MRPETPSDPTHRFLRFRQGPLAYCDEGVGPPTIVAIPGLPGSTRDFRWLAPALSPRARFLRIDPPGYGLSTRRGFAGRTIAERAEPVLALIEELDLAPTVLLGHSAGGTVVAHLGRHHPEHVAGCVFLASAGPHPHYAVGLYRSLSGIFRSSPGRALMRPLLRSLYRRLGFPASLTDDERMYTSLDAATMGFQEHRDNLDHLSRPALLAWARDDRLIRRQTFEDLDEIAPAGPRLLFDTGGHNIQKTRANELAEAILEFSDPVAR